MTSGTSIMRRLIINISSFTALFLSTQRKPRDPRQICAEDDSPRGGSRACQGSTRSQEEGSLRRCTQPWHYSPASRSHYLGWPPLWEPLQERRANSETKPLTGTLHRFARRFLFHLSCLMFSMRKPSALGCIYGVTLPQSGGVSVMKAWDSPLSSVHFRSWPSASSRSLSLIHKFSQTQSRGFPNRRSLENTKPWEASCFLAAQKLTSFFFVVHTYGNAVSKFWKVLHDSVDRLLSLRFLKNKQTNNQNKASHQQQTIKSVF